MTDHWSMPLASVTADGNIEPDNIVYNQLSSNGLFYGINKYLLPKSFETAAGPIFGNKEFSWFCELLVFYKVDILLNNEDIDYSVFAPTNQAMAAAGYSARDGLGGFGLYHSQNPLSPVPRSRALDLIKSHIVAQDMQEADFEDGTFLPTIQNTYIGVTDEGIFGGANALATPIGTALRSGVNGVVYPIQKMLLSPSSDLLQIISDQSSYPEFSEFYGLLQESGLITLDQSYSFALLSNLATGVRYTCLIPSNEAILEGKSSGVIPDDTEQLKQFLRYYFIDGTIFTDGEKSGSFKTTRYADETHNIYSPITVINEKDNLRIQDNPGNIHQVISGNIMATNGVIHRISSLLIY
jgi:uncharacterized surface protein with fasciclin (FAS1) repeats